jgi:hypothetical protein
MGSRAPLGTSPLGLALCHCSSPKIRFFAHGLRCFRGCLQLIDLVALIWGISMQTSAEVCNSLIRGELQVVQNTKSADLPALGSQNTTTSNYITHGGKVKGWAKIFSMILSNAHI